MKSFTFQFLFLVAMAMASSSAFADVQLQVVADPEDGSFVESLSTITVSFPQYGENFNFTKYSRPVYVTNDATGESAVTKASADWKMDDSFDKIVITCSPSITTLGDYTVTIPAGTFKFWDSDDNATVYDLPIVLHYTVSQSTGISDVKVEGGMNGILVNLNGQRVGDDYQGVVIEDGKKLIQK